MFSFDVAIQMVNEGNKMTRRKWPCHHITKINNPECKFNGEIVYGSVINGYKIYNASEADKNAVDWVVYNR